MMFRTWTRRGFGKLAFASLTAIAMKRAPSVIAAPDPGHLPQLSENTSVSGYCPVGEELTLLTLINNYRKANGRSSLRISRTLGAAAEHHSVDMAKSNYFSHTLANGTSWSTNIKNHGYTASSSIGENIAAGHTTAKDTFTQWRNSSGHNANMLSSTYRAIGIGRAYQSSSKYDFYWTTTFGGTFDAAPSC
jgi:uncharacterized protein YkwD